jgi:hypothetical protein
VFIIRKQDLRRHQFAKNRLSEILSQHVKHHPLFEASGASVFDFANIFAEENLSKKLTILTQNTPIYAETIDHNNGFQDNSQFFPQKIGLNSRQSGP